MREALLLFLLPIASMIAGIWSIVATCTWRGGWRWAGAVPLIAFFAWIGIVLVPAGIKDPTSHNLWPFEVGIYLSPSLPYMAIAAGVRRNHLRSKP